MNGHNNSLSGRHLEVHYHNPVLREDACFRPETVDTNTQATERLLKQKQSAHMVFHYECSVNE